MEKENNIIKFNNTSNNINQPLTNDNSILLYNETYELTNDPLLVLSQMETVEIRQELEIFEILTGCETPNRYNVLGKTNNGQLVYLFKCKEDSSCCDRSFCSPNSRPFKMNIKHITNKTIYESGSSFENYFAFFDRPYKYTCCNSNRPFLNGYYNKNYNTNYVPIGDNKVKKPINYVMDDN